MMELQLDRRIIDDGRRTADAPDFLLAVRYFQAG